MVVRDLFEDTIEANSGTQHFMRETPESASYASLLLAELSGSYRLVARERENHAKVLLLKRSEHEFETGEALRLLRNSGAIKTMRSALIWFRNQGPTAAIVFDALRVLDRIEKYRWRTETDLLLFELSADFLPVAVRERALNAIFSDWNMELPPQGADWVYQNRIWKAAARLVPKTSLLDSVLSRALEMLGAATDIERQLAETIARIVDKTNWKSIDSDLALSWKTWARENEAIDSSSLMPIVNSILRSTSDNSSSNERVLDLEDVAKLVDSTTSDLDGVTLSGCGIILVESLRTEMKASKGGAFSQGGLSASNVASAFVLKFGSEPLWGELISFLGDPDVFAELKTLAVERLAREPERIPAREKRQLVSVYRSLLASKNSGGFFGDSSPKYFTSAIRLGIAIDAIGFDDSLGMILDLASAMVSDRIEAAKTIPFELARSKDPVWGQVLLLQLSHDSDPSVRAEAGKSLAQSLNYQSGLHAQVVARIEELLRCDGIQVPLATLHGLQMIAARNVRSVLNVSTIVYDVVRDTKSSVVCEAAEVVLSLLGRETNGELEPFN
ncbi:hypothetical protein CQ019_03825 [Arthrobacter sp. MYb229]|nr:hypothetical protein CQ019_03825 [Arthrobacter sp. MYb229]PRB53421.1 hypothetical protein CQ013_03825 [Arthrobacter sp. MYb216]